MAKPIAKLIFCDNIKVERNGDDVNSSISNILSMLQPVNIPGNYSFCVACIFNNIDTSKKNTTQFIFKDENGNIVFDTDSLSFPDINLSDSKNNSPTTIQLNLDLRNIILQSEGTYSAELILNGDIVAKDTILVKKV